MDIHQIFKSLNANTIQEWISDGKQENLYLEFKTISDPRLTHASDKKNVAKTISGFANSNGGIVVWGIVARKNDDGVDCAVELKEISNVNLLLARLNECTGMAVSPIVDGVEHKVVETKSNIGVIVTYVPESISGPHMAKLGEDRYFKRSGDSFYRMEHFDLEDMFGRRQKPKLNIIYRVTGLGENVSIILSLRNDGRGSARAPYLGMDVNMPYTVDIYGVDGNRTHGLRRIIHGGGRPQYRFGESSDFVIHPGVSHDVTKIKLATTKGNCGPNSDVVIKAFVTADGMKPMEGELIIPLAELA